MRKEKRVTNRVYFYRGDSNEDIVKIGETVVAVSTNQFPGVHWRARIRALVFRGSRRAEKCRRPRQTP